MSTLPSLRTPRWFVTIIITTLTVGALVIAASIFPDFDVSLTIANAPVWLTLWIGAQTSLGALKSLAGVSLGVGSRAWHMQQVGIWLMWGGYTSYAIASIVAFPRAMVHSILAAAFAALCFIRFLDLRRLEKVALDSVDST